MYHVSKRYNLYIQSVLMFGIFFFAGCATSPDHVTNAITVDEQSLRQQSKQMNKSIAQGAATGAVLGGLLGALMGGDRKSVLIGVGAGAIMGGVGGYYVAKRQQDYANEEARIQAMITDVENDNKQLSEYIQTAHRVIESDKQRIKDIERQYASQEIALAAARAKFEQIRENRQIIAETIHAMHKKKAEYQYALDQTKQNNPESDLLELNDEIIQLEQQVAALEQDLDSLDDALALSKLG